jgi:hypothetical protein
MKIELNFLLLFNYLYSKWEIGSLWTSLRCDVYLTVNIRTPFMTWRPFLEMKEQTGKYALLYLFHTQAVAFLKSLFVTHFQKY